MKRPLNDTTTLTEMQSSLTNGTFTPFLGAGVSSLRPSECDIGNPPWDRLARNLFCIAKAIREDKKSSDSDATVARLNYLHELAMDRLHIDDGIWTKILSGGLGRCASHEDGGHCGNLVAFQASLVGLVTELTRVFGRRFSEKGMPVRQLGEIEVLLEEADEGQAVDTLMDMIQSLRKPFPTRGSGFKNHGAFRYALGFKLLWAFFELSSEKARTTPRVKDFLCGNQDLLDRLAEDCRDPAHSGVARLRLDLLEWLSHLLWFSIIYHIRYPATTDELAFSLSLENVGLAPPRRMDLAQVAQLMIDGENLSKTIGERVRLWYESNKQRTSTTTADNLHRSISAAVYSQYCKYREKVEAQRKLQGRIPSAALSPDNAVPDNQTTATIPLPLLFTTNFDCALENVFESARLNYHVVYPARTGGGTVQWVFHTQYAAQSGQKKTFDDDIDANDAFYQKTCAPKKWDLLGPIIVKLHGSPLTVLPDWGDVTHHLVLSEAEYLRSMAQDRALPHWIESQLGDNCGRYLLFMGYSISDWNIRLVLFRARQLPQVGIERMTRKEASSWTVELREDPIRWKLLEPFRVGIYVGDLNRLPGYLEARMPVLTAEDAVRTERLLKGGNE